MWRRFGLLCAVIPILAVACSSEGGAQEEVAQEEVEQAAGAQAEGAQAEGAQEEATLEETAQDGPGQVIDQPIMVVANRALSASAQPGDGPETIAIAAGDRLHVIGRDETANWIAVLETGTSGSGPTLGWLEAAKLSLPAGLRSADLDVFAGPALWIADVTARTRSSVQAARSVPIGWIGLNELVYSRLGEDGTWIWNSASGDERLLSAELSVFSISVTGQLGAAGPASGPPEDAALSFMMADGVSIRVGESQTFGGSDYPQSPGRPRSSWSDDGTRLVLETNSGVPVIYEWGVDEQATSPGTSPGWSGDDIVLLQGRTIMRWTAAETRSLGLDARDIVVAPGGQLIARLRGDSCCFGRVDLVDLGGRAVLDLGEGGLHPGMWSPTAEHIIVRGRDGLVITNIATGATAELDDTSGQVVVWSPDGSMVAVLSAIDEDFGNARDPRAGIFGADLRIYATDGSLVWTIARTFNDVRVSWSPDGRFIAFRSRINEA